MAYTALAKMRKKNLKEYGVNAGPREPDLYKAGNKNSLKCASLRFLHNACEGLKFDASIEAEEDKSGVYQGTSLKPGQIPYNMQMDINRLCLEKSLEKFIDSGTAEDAYMVYYSYLEIFLGHYGKSKKMIELLAEFESNGSSLLMKHRDHYSHSVYVFALGLAVYETNARYRSAFEKYITEKKQTSFSSPELANIFLEYWGMASLFHDIGYPFELPFEQVMSYFEVNNQKRGKDHPFLAYKDIDTLTGFDKVEAAHFKKLYGKKFRSCSELFAHDITEKLGSEYGFSEDYILNIIRSKPTCPEKFGHFMDHAVFSAIRLYRELVSSLGADNITGLHVRRVDMSTVVEEGREAMESSTEWRFWKKEYWADFKFIKPTINLQVILGALSIVMLNIGANISFGGITASIAGMSQNYDHLSIINSLADIPSALFGGPPIEAIISGTAGAPWPVACGIVFMLVCGILVLTGLVSRLGKYLPAQSISGFLLVIGFALTFAPNLQAVAASENPISGYMAMGVTAWSQNPFLGMVVGVLTRFFGHYVGLV